LNAKSAAQSSSVILGTITSASQSSGFQFPPPAPWLADVQRRLRNSVGVPTAAGPDGRWLASGVVYAASSFFQATSDMLPAEPYLHSSLQGDLVAEFNSPYGPITMVVSGDHALAMATVQGQPVQSRMQLAGAQPDTLRAELAKITEALRTGRYGPLDAVR
jgi:hypothetical protein